MVLGHLLFSCLTPPHAPPLPSPTAERSNSICLLVAFISRGWNSWLRRVNWRDEMRAESQPCLMDCVEYKHTHNGAHTHIRTQTHTWSSSTENTPESPLEQRISIQLRRPNVSAAFWEETRHHSKTMLLTTRAPYKGENIFSSHTQYRGEPAYLLQ